MINDDVYTRMKRENEQHALTILDVGSGKIKFKIGEAEKVGIVSIDEFEQLWLKERVYIKNISELKKVKAPANQRLDKARYVRDKLSLMDALRAIQRVAVVVFENPDEQVSERGVSCNINASGHTEYIMCHIRINHKKPEMTYAHLVLEVLDKEHVELLGHYGDGKTDTETKKLDWPDTVMLQLKRKVKINYTDMQKTEAMLEKIIIPFFRNGEGGKKIVANFTKQTQGTTISR